MYVPQHVYLLDSSILENIALGTPGNVDMDRILVACEQAQLKTFIESLPHGLNTFVGERGVKLSGGQRQRIGIARALYKNTEILILDEATSALDDKTESSFVDMINCLQDSITVVMIAHRTSTLRDCDTILRVSGGSIKAVPRDNLFPK